MKYRSITHTRQVEHTIDGITHLVPEHHTIQVPVPPRDWDRIILTTAITATAMIVIGSIIWSTASIGGLLSRVVPAGIAYTGAVTFDAAWITCMAIEWLARYDRTRARLPRIAGTAALTIAMTAVAMDGWTTGNPAVGIIGATISGLAKGLWTVLIKHMARPLDARTQAWAERQHAEVSARLGLVALRRQLDRAEAAIAAERAARALPANTTKPTPDNPPDRPAGQPDRASGTVRSAVRAALDTMPDATPADIAATLAGLGIRVTPDTVRDMSAPDTGHQARHGHPSSDTVVRPIRPTGGDTITDTIRASLASGITSPDTVLSAVRSVHGQHVPRDTVTRTIRRLTKSA